MKILAFVDTHGNEKHLKIIRGKIKKFNPELLICAGDITIFESDIEKQMEILSGLGKKVLLLPGNHEGEEILYMLSAFYENIIFLHQAYYRMDGYFFIGYGGDGFRMADKKFEKVTKKLIKDLKPGEKVVLVTHGPPYGTELDLLNNDHIGNKSYKDFIKKHKPILSICGHLHENSGKEDKLFKIINPGPDGKIIDI